MTRIAVILGALMVSAAWTAPAESPTLPGALIFLNSAPLGAEASLDGRGLGRRTPLLLSDLPPGRHRIDLRKQGFRPHSLQIEVAGGELRALSVDLSERGISTTFPAEREVRVRGEAQPAGEQILYFEQGGYTISREGDVVHVDPLFPQQRLIDALNLSIPIMIGFAGLLTVDAVLNRQDSGWPLPPAVLAAHGVTLTMVGLDIGLNLRKRRQLSSYSFAARSAEINRQAADRLYAEAEQQLERGALEEALAGYSKLIGSLPDSPLLPAALYRVGSIHYLLGENDQAVRSFEELTREYPVPELYDKCRKNLADLMLRKGSFEESLGHLEAMVFADPLYSREEIDFYGLSILEEWLESDPSLGERYRQACAELIQRYPDSPGSEAVRARLRGLSPR